MVERSSFSEQLRQLESSGYASVAIQDVTHLGLISLFWRDSPGGGRLRLLGQYQEALSAAAVVAHLLV